MFFLMLNLMLLGSQKGLKLVIRWIMCCGSWYPKSLGENKMGHMRCWTQGFERLPRLIFGYIGDVLLFNLHDFHCSLQFKRLLYIDIYIYMFLYMIFSIYTIWSCVSNLIHAILVTNVIIWILLPSPTNFDLKNCLNVVIETQVALLRSVLQSAVRVPVPEGKRWTQHLMIWLFGDMFRGDEMCL